MLFLSSFSSYTFGNTAYDFSLARPNLLSVYRAFIGLSKFKFVWIMIDGLTMETSMFLYVISSFRMVLSKLSSLKISEFKNVSISPDSRETYSS